MSRNVLVSKNHLWLSVHWFRCTDYWCCSRVDIVIFGNALPIMSQKWLVIAYLNPYCLTKFISKDCCQNTPGRW